MTRKKTLKTKPPKYPDMVDMCLLAAGLSQTSALLHQVCDSLFKLGASTGKRWDRDSQEWVLTNNKS